MAQATERLDLVKDDRDPCGFQRSGERLKERGVTGVVTALPCNQFGPQCGVPAGMPLQQVLHGRYGALRTARRILRVPVR